jgi:hypothetical protein
VRVSELPTLNQEQNVAFDILDPEPSRTEVVVAIEPAKVVDVFEIVVAVDLVKDILVLEFIDVLEFDEVLMCYVLGCG